jgi:hypothetical protein
MKNYPSYLDSIGAGAGVLLIFLLGEISMSSPLPRNNQQNDINCTFLYETIV